MHDFAPRKTFRGVFHPSKHDEPKNYRYARIGSNKKILPTDDVNRIDEKSTRKRGARGRPGRHEPFLQGDKEGGYATEICSYGDGAVGSREKTDLSKKTARRSALSNGATHLCKQHGQGFADKTMPESADMPSVLSRVHTHRGQRPRKGRGATATAA